MAGSNSHGQPFAHRSPAFTDVSNVRSPHSRKIVRTAPLRLIEEQDQLRAIRLEETRKKIDEGLAALDRGEGIDGEEALD